MLLLCLSPPLHVCRLFLTLFLLFIQDGEAMLVHFRRLPQFLQDFLLHESPFGSFLRIPAIHERYNFFRALPERWRFETHTFHFPYGEMTILAEHWALLSGLTFGGEPIVGKGALGYSQVPELLGRPAPEQTRSTYNFHTSWLREWDKIWPNSVPSSREAVFVLRHFLLDLLGVIFCNVSRYFVHTDWLIYIADVGELWRYDWGGASYAYLLCGLDDVVRRNYRSYISLYPLVIVSDKLLSVLN